MKFIVYKYTSPSKKNYIGVTFNEERRKKEHEKKEWDMKETAKFARAIQHHGFNRFSYEVLEAFDNPEQMYEREIYWIKFYDSVESGYNHQPGGLSGGGNFTYDDKVIENIIFMLKNRYDLTLQEIADINEVSVPLVSSIMNGKSRNMEKISRPNKARKGSTNPASKLNEDQIQEIKEKLKNGTPRKAIQSEYEISKTLVQLIATGQSWGHVESSYEYKPLEVNGNAKLNDDIVRELKKDMMIMKAQLVAEKYDISVATVRQIKQGRTWKHIK